MEKKVIFAVMVMLLFVGQAMGSFESCYAGCYVECIIGIGMKRTFPLDQADEKFTSCGWKCLKHCIFHGGDAFTDVDYCNIGCTMDSCSDNVDDAKKMAGCFDNCSNTSCKKKP